MLACDAVAARRPPRTLAAVRPNAGIRAAYQRRLDGLILELQGDLTDDLLPLYIVQEGRIAFDASPATALSAAIKKLSRRWAVRSYALAGELGDYFARSTLARSDASLRSSLRRGGTSVRFQFSKPMRDAYDAVRAEQVGLIGSIAMRHLSEVEGLVLRSVQAGRDAGTLTRELQDQFKVTRRRAAFIARDQSSKATAVLCRARQADLGITEAIWRHSGAGKEPRPEHVAFSGKRYDISKGAFLEGEWVWPGTAINCRCTSESILPGD